MILGGRWRVPRNPGGPEHYGPVVAAEIPVFRPIALAVVLGCAVVTMADSDAAPTGLPKGCSQINSQLVSCTYSTPSAAPVKFTVPAGVNGVTITARGGTG